METEGKVSPPPSKAFDHERFHNVSAGIQSLVTVLGIIAAGAWALFSFSSLRSEQKADAEIASLENSARQEPVLQIDLDAFPSTAQAAGARHVYVHVKLKNDGKRALEFSAPRLRVVRFDGIGAPPVSSEAQYVGENGSLIPAGDRILRSGQGRTVLLVAPIAGPGDYLLQVETTYGGLDNIKGSLESSTDDPIIALEQKLFSAS